VVDDTDTLRVGGLCAAGELELSRSDCAALASEHQIPDVSSVLPERRGTAVRFHALVQRARPASGARFVNLASEDGLFTACVRLEELVETGIVLYANEGAALPREFGGPFRLLMTSGENCSLNVKFLASVEFAAQRGVHTAACADDD